MSYHSLDDLKKDMDEREIIQLTQDDEALGMINEQNHDEASDDAAGVIDGSLIGGGYNLPLSPVPRLIKKISKDITIFYLYQRRKRASMPESVQKSYDNALKLLDKIQKGEIRLGVAEESSIAGGIYKTNKTADDRMFSKTELEKF